MARLPIYRSLTDPRQGASIDLPRASEEAFGAGFGASLQRAGGLIEQRGRRMAAEAEEKADNAAMTEAARLFEEANAATIKGLQDLRDGAPEDGAGHVDRALADLDKRRDDVLGRLQGNEKARSWAERGFIRLRGDVEVKEAGFAAGLRANKVVSDYSSARDLAANGLFTNPDRAGLDATISAHDEVVDGLTVSAEVKAKLKAENRALMAEQYARGLAERDPYRLRAEIDSGAMNALLKPDQLAEMRNRADTEVRGREAQARMEEAARRQAIAAARAAAQQAERDRRDAARDYVDGIYVAAQAGVPVPMATMAEAARISAQLGNPGKSVAITTLGVRNEVNVRYGNMSPVLLQQEEQRLSAAIAKAGPNADPAMIAARDQLRTLRAAQRDGTRTDLLGWEARYGAEIPALDPADPASFQRRAQTAKAAGRRYGVRPQPLTSTEADAYARLFAEGSPAQKAAAARELALFGPLARDAAVQVGSRSSPTMAFGIALAAQGNSVAAGDLFAGAEYLKAKPDLAPKDEVDARFIDTMGDAFRYMPDAVPHVKAAATAIYAARWGREGGTEWRGKAWDAGLRMALGAVRGSDGRDRGGIGSWNGEPVVLPVGVTQEAFENGIAAITDESLKRRPTMRPVGARGEDISADAIRRGKLYAAGADAYYVVLDGATAPLRRADGDLFRLYVRAKP